jgi:hypothetical protein
MLDRSRKFSAHQIALFGCGAMFIPYLFAIAYLYAFALPAKMVGPVLSLMLLNIFYLLLPFVYLVLRKVDPQGTDLSL